MCAAVSFDEAGVADDPPQLIFGGAMVGAGGRDHVPLNHDAPDVERARAQPQPASLQPRGDPGGLHAHWTIEMVMGIYQSEQAGARVAFPLKARRHPLEA